MGRPTWATEEQYTFLVAQSDEFKKLQGLKKSRRGKENDPNDPIPKFWPVFFTRWMEMWPVPTLKSIVNDSQATASKAEAPADDSTFAGTQAPTEPPTDDSVFAGTQAPTEPAADSSAFAGTQTATGSPATASVSTDPQAPVGTSANDSISTAAADSQASQRAVVTKDRKRGSLTYEQVS